MTTVRDLERDIRRRYGLSRTEARIVLSRGKRWRWLAWLSPALFAWVVVLSMPHGGRGG